MREEKEGCQSSASGKERKKRIGGREGRTTNDDRIRIKLRDVLSRAEGERDDLELGWLALGGSGLESFDGSGKGGHGERAKRSRWLEERCELEA